MQGSEVSWHLCSWAALRRNEHHIRRRRSEESSNLLFDESLETRGGTRGQSRSKCEERKESLFKLN